MKHNVDHDQLDDEASDGLPTSRDYQIELLKESLRRNIIITLPTGTGKTHVAILRIQHHLMGSQKLAWFLCPTVALCQQQHTVISAAIPKVMMISGAMEPERWSSQAIWRSVVEEHSVVVSTPQILLDALSHSHLKMRDDIGLLIFDEAHHAIGDHPYNRIMKESYHLLKHDERPGVLGLTASPVFGTDIQKHLGRLESDLDAIVRLPRMHEAELAQFVYKPELRYASYSPPFNPFDKPSDPLNLSNLINLVKGLDVEQDPWVKSSRQLLSRMPTTDPKRHLFEQRLAKTVYKRDTYTLRNLKALHRACEDLYLDVGIWALDQYMQSAIERVLTSLRPEVTLGKFGNQEKGYFLPLLKELAESLEAPPPLGSEDSVTPKVRKLIETLLKEKEECDVLGVSFVGLLLVRTRASALTLKDLLTLHPDTARVFNCGCLVGLSSHSQRKASNMFDISHDAVLVDEYQHTLDQFRLGSINLLIATSVAEEGLDIQACGSVIRFDLPLNLQSWTQSQGRARKQRSTFTLLIQDDLHRGLVAKWEDLSERIVEMCRIERERLLMLKIGGDEDESDAYNGDEDDEIIEVESTGARLTLASAVGHLDFFCAKFPHSPYSKQSPTYEFSPSQKYTLFHPTGADQLDAPQGPFGATVTLPSLIPPHLRTFTTPEIYRSTRSAKRHVALQAYRALYKAGLLSDTLLPFQFPPTTDRESIDDLLKDVEGREGLVIAPRQMDPWIAESDIPSQQWQRILISIEGVISLWLYAPTNLTHYLDNFSFPIFDVSDKRREVRLRRPDPGVSEGFDKSLAEQFTRALMWVRWGGSMRWDSLDYAYLFLPFEEDAWAREIASLTDDDFYNSGEEYIQHHTEVVYPTIAKGNDGQPLLVEGISFDQPSASEIEAYLALYPKSNPSEFHPPFFKVRNLPRKADFLDSPRQGNADDRRSLRERKLRLIRPSALKICRVRTALVHASLLLPCILEFLKHLMIAHAGLSIVRNLDPPPISLDEVPFDTVLAAFTATAAGRKFDYERLETLGDAVLKIAASISLLEKNEFWHEDYLTKAKDHIVSNGSLSRAAIRNHMARFIIRIPFRGRKWVPLQRKVESSQQKGADDQDPLSTKMLADIIEALLGACYIRTEDRDGGGFQACSELLECILPQKGMTWSLPSALAKKLNERCKEVFYYPPQLMEVENALGYEFKNKTHLLEALTHSSHQQLGHSWRTYERHEFLGDAVLDIIIAKWFYKATAGSESDLVGAKPGQLHLCKSATVNADLLGFLCFQVKCSAQTTVVIKEGGKDGEHGGFVTKSVDEIAPLWKYLFHSSSLILDQQDKCALRCARSRDAILSALHTGSVYPWAELRGLLLPKIFSDIIESVIGAIYIDSSGNLDECSKFLERIGLIKFMRRFAASSSPSLENTLGIDVRHPTSVWGEWTALRDTTFGYLYETSLEGKTTCSLVADQEVVGTAEGFGKGPQIRDALKLAAIENALTRLQCRVRLHE